MILCEAPLFSYKINGFQLSDGVCMQNRLFFSPALALEPQAF